MMALPDANPAAREATAAISMVQRPSYGRRNRAGPGGHFHGPAVTVVLHHDAGRVARQTLRRFRGNVRAILGHGLAGGVSIGQHGRIDMNHDLITLARRAGIKGVVQRGLGDERQGIRLLLLERRLSVETSPGFSKVRGVWS